MLDFFFFLRKATIYHNAEAKWKVIEFDFWIGDEQRGKEVEVVGRGEWAMGGAQKMGPQGQHLMGAEKKGHHPAKIPGLA